MRYRTSHRIGRRAYQGYDDETDELYIYHEYEPKLWGQCKRGLNRERTIRGRSRRQHAPYHNDPLIWILMSILQNFALVGVAVGIIKQMMVQSDAGVGP